MTYRGRNERRRAHKEAEREAALTPRLAASEAKGADRGHMRGWDDCERARDVVHASDYGATTIGSGECPKCGHEIHARPKRECIVVPTPSKLASRRFSTPPNYGYELAESVELYACEMALRIDETRSIRWWTWIPRGGRGEELARLTGEVGRLRTELRRVQAVQQHRRGWFEPERFAP